MNLEIAQKDIREVRAHVRQQNWIILFLLAICTMSISTVLYQVGHERTIVTSPNINKSFWVTGDKVSGSYLEQMGEFMAYLVLDVSPANIDYKKSIFLTYVTPDAHGDLNTRMELEAARLKRDNATTMFSIQQLTPDEDKMSIVMKGRLTTFINDRRISEVERSYLAEFQYKGGRISLKTFKETNDVELNTAAAAVSATAAVRAD